MIYKRVFHLHNVFKHSLPHYSIAMNAFRRIHHLRTVHILPDKLRSRISVIYTHRTPPILGS